MRERLQKILSSCGVCSRRAAEELIRVGRVKVNGHTVTLGEQADIETDVVEVDSRRVRGRNDAPIWLMLNKPKGYVVTLSDEKGRRTAASLVSDCGRRVWPVGRLDMNSEGLLLFTDDGEGTNRVLHPSREVDKEYMVCVSGDIDNGLSVLSDMTELDGEKLAPVKLSVLRRTGNTAIVSVTIHEGKNRQIRRMCSASSLYVENLRRIREGNITLGDLAPGSWRYLTGNEITELLRESR